MKGMPNDTGITAAVALNMYEGNSLGDDGDVGLPV